MFCCRKDKKCDHVQQGISFICLKSDCPEQVKQPCKQCYKNHKCSNEYIIHIKSQIVDNNQFQVELQDIYQFLEEHKSSSNYCKTLIINYNSILLKQVNYFDLYLKQSLDQKYKGLFKQFINEGTDQIQIIPFIYEGIQELHQLLSNKITYNVSDDSLQLLSLNFQKLEVQDSQRIIEHLQQKTLELDSRIKYNMGIQEKNMEKDEFYFIFQEQKSIERFCQEHRQIKSDIFEVPSFDNKTIQLILSCKLCALKYNLKKYDLNQVEFKKQQINQLYKQIEKFKYIQMKEYQMIASHFDVIRKDIEQKLKNNVQIYCQNQLKDYDYELSDLGILRQQLLKKETQELYNMQCVNMLRKIKRKYDNNQRILILIEQLESDLTNIIKVYNQKINSLFKIIFSKDFLEYQLDTGRLSLDSKQLDTDKDLNPDINIKKETKGNQSKLYFKSGLLKKRVNKLEPIPEDKQQKFVQFQLVQDPDPTQTKEGVLQDNSKVITPNIQIHIPNQDKPKKEDEAKFPVIIPVYSYIIEKSNVNDEVYQKIKQQQEQLDQQEKLRLQEQQKQLLIQQQNEQQQEQLIQQKQREKEQLEKQQQEEQKRLQEQKKQQEQQELEELKKKQQQQNNQIIQSIQPTQPIYPMQPTQPIQPIYPVQPILVVSQIINPNQDNNDAKLFPKPKNEIIFQQPSVPLDMKEKIKSQFNTLSVEIDNKQSKKSYFEKQNSISQISVQFSQKYQKDYILYLNSDNQIFKQKNNKVELQVQLPDESDYLIKQFLFWKIDKLIRQQSQIKDGPRYFLRANTFGQGHILVYDIDRNKIDIDLTGKCETINNIQFFNNSIISCSSDGKLILYENQIDIQPRYINLVRSELDIKNKLVQISIIDNQSFIVLQHPQIDEKDRSVLFFDTIISLVSYDSKTQKMKQEKDRRFNDLVMKIAIHNDKLVLGFKTGKVIILTVKDLNQKSIYEETLSQKQPILGIAFNSRGLGIIQTNKVITIRKFDQDMRIEEKLEIEKFYDYESGEPQDIVIVDDQLIFSDRSILRLQNL